MTITDYRNFDLLITRAGDRYRAFVVDAPEGEASVVFDLPFTPDEMPRLGGSGVVRGVSRQIGAADAPGYVTSLTAVGSRLFEAIFRDKVLTLLAASLSSMAHEGAGLRLRLRFEEDAAELAALPWETLYDPAQAHFIGLGEQSPILRYLSLPRSRSALLVEPPLRVLAVLASPTGLPPLDMEREWQVIQDALAGLTADGKFVLERLTTPSLSGLQARLLGESVHILHFVGHGVFDESSQAGSLALEDERGRAQLVQGEHLAALLRNHPAMRLTYLNACEGALASGQSVFTGVAQTMVQQGVPAAVAMQAEISDTGAIELARTFYTALAGGRPVDAALTQARVALSVAGSQEWAIPVLFSRSPDNRLFDIREVLPTPDCPYPGMTPFSEAQQAFFFGRDMEIGEAVERLRQHPFLTVVGPSGSGKSSLVYAGVIPALRKSKRFGPGEWSVQIMRPGQHPVAALAEKLGCSPETLSSVAFSERILLFVDQFEETFTLAEAGEAQAFLEALQGLIGRPNLHILLTVRADFYPELMASSLWQPIRANRLELTPLGDDELWAAIVEPAARVGVTVDEALAVQLIADAAGQSGVLPLVQETLVLLWERVERRQLGLATYKAMAEGGRSGLQVAIDRRASVVYENLPTEAQPIARRIFLRLIQFGEGRADTRRQQTVAELRASGDDPALFDQTLATLTASRLLTTSGEEGGDRRVDIAHEALITGWPRLQEWQNQRRAAEQTRRYLEGKAAEWVAAEKRGGLLDEYELQEAENWLGGEDARELGYNGDLVELVHVSEVVLGEAAAKEAEAARSQQRSRILAGGLTLAILAVILVGYLAWAAQTARNEAETAELTAETAATAEAMARLQAVAEAQKAAANETEALVAKATAEASQVEVEAAKAEVERLTRGIRADQLTANALKIMDESPPLALLLAVEGIRTQSDFVVSEVITESASLMSSTLVTHSVMASETVVASALTNVYELLDQVGGIPLSGHTAAVTGLAFSPDGRWLVTGSKDGTARLWNMKNPTTVPYVFQGHAGPIATVTFSPDGHWIATASGSLGYPWEDPADNTVRLWNVDNPAAAPYVLQGHVGSVAAMAFSPDSHWLATGSHDKTARLWSVIDPTAAPRVLLGHTERVMALGFSPDGRWLATGSTDHTVRIWNVGDNIDTSQVLQGHTDQISTVAFSPDGHWLATGSWDHTIRLWNLADLTQAPIILSGHAEVVLSMAFSLDSRYLATGATDKTARLWDVANPTVPPRILQGQNGWVNAVAFSFDGHWLATGSSTAVQLWNVADSTVAPRLLLGHEGNVTAVAFSPDGQWLASGSADKTARLWNLANPIAAALVLQAHEDSVHAIGFSPDGHWLASGSADNTARLWNVTDFTSPSRLLEGHTDSVNAVAFSPDNRWLATGSADQTARLWDMNDPSNNPVVFRVQDRSLSAVAFSPDGRWLATGTNDTTVWLWDSTNPLGAPRSFEGHRGSIASVSFSPDGRWLATVAYDATARLWSTVDSTIPPMIFQSPEPTFYNAAALSPDSRMIALGAQDNTTQLWNVTDPIIPPRIIRGHTDGVNAVTFDPSGRWLATGSADHTARLWDVKDSSGAARILQGHTDSVNALAFSPDGRWLATASSDKTVRLWPWRVEDVIAVACRLTGRNLSAEEWAQYFSDLPFRKTCPQWPVHPSMTQALREWARVLAEHGDVTKAATKLREAIALDPSLSLNPEAEAKRIYASSLAERGDIAGATTVYTEAVDINPSMEIEPEREAKRIYAQQLVEEARSLAEKGNIESAISKYQAAVLLDPDLEIEPETEAKRIYAPRVIQQARDLIRKNDIVGAVNNIDEALALNPNQEISANDWNALCWLGATMNRADMVLDACEAAVRLAPNNGQNRDSRGLARALTGNVDGAIEDFEFALAYASAEGWGDEYIASRTAWVHALRTDTDPEVIFNEATLERLRN